MKQEGATLPIFQGKTGQARNGRGGEAGEETHEPHQSVQNVGGGSVLETHRMSPRAASCFSATWRSWRGSPSSSSRSFSPYRLPSPRVRFVLSQTHRERNKLYTKVQHWTGSEVHTHTHTHTRGKKRGEEAGREQEGGRWTPVVVDLLLDLRHGCLLSLTESRTHILTASQAQVCDGAEGRQQGEGWWGAGGYISSGPPSLLTPCGPRGQAGILSSC